MLLITMVGPSAARAGLVSVVTPTAGANALAVLGNAEPGADIAVTTTSMVTLCTVTADGLGDFTCYFPSPLAEGTEVLVTSTVGAETSSPVSVFVDTTAPPNPIPNPSNGTFFAGSAEASSTVRIRSTPGGVELCVTTASPTGTYTCMPASPAGAGFEVYAVDAVGNTGNTVAITFDNTAPAAPALVTNGTGVVGTAEAGSSVTVIDTSLTTRCTATAAGDGSVTCTISSAPAVIADLTATATDAAGNTSAPAALTPDTTPPAAPALVPSPIARTHASGTAEVGATITASHLGTPLCTLVVGGLGLFDCAWSTPLLDGDTVDFTTTDPVGNQTASSATVDGVGPAAPTLVSITGSSITLTVEANSTVTITGWPTSCPPPTLTNVTCTFTGVPTHGTALTAIATDAAGNPSSPLVHTVDTTAGAPTGVRSWAATTTGTAAAGSTVRVRTTSASGTIICTTTADGTTGTFTCPHTPSQTAGTRLFATSTNSFGTTSSATQVIVAQGSASIGVTLTVTVDPGATTAGPVNLRIRATRDDNVNGTTINPVVIKIDGSAVASRLLTSGAAATVIDVAPLALGLHSIELSYTGTTTLLPALAFATVDVTTATAVTAPSINAVSGEAVTLVAGVATSPASPTIPTGQVQFLDGATLLGTAVLDPSGQAQLPNQFLAVGTHWITVAYQGAPGFAASNGTLQVVVSRSITVLTLSASNVTHLESQPLTAQLTVVAPGAGQPTGTIIFYDGATSLGSAPVDPSGQAVLNASFPVGPHTLSASYTGDTDFLDDVSPTVAITVSQAPVLVTVSPDPLSAVEGATASIAVHTSPIVPAAGVPAGTVTAYPGLATSGPTLGSATLDGSGDATVILSGLISTDTQLTVVYEGSSTHAASSVVGSVTVSPPAPTTTTTTTTTVPPTTTTSTTTTTVPPTSTTTTTTSTSTTTTTVPPTTTTTVPPTTTTSTTTTTVPPTTTTSTTTTAVSPSTTFTAPAPTTTSPPTTTQPSARRAPTSTAPRRASAPAARRPARPSATTTPAATTSSTSSTTSTTTTVPEARLATRTRFLSPSPGRFPAGEAINIRIAVTNRDRSADGKPGGDVEVRRGRELVCVITLDRTGKGQCATDAPVGRYSLTADYLGNDAFAPSSARLGRAGTSSTDDDGSPDSTSPDTTTTTTGADAKSTDAKSTGAEDTDAAGDIEVVPAADVEIAFQVGIGAEIEGATVQAWGDNLPANAQIVLEVHSTPVEVARFTTDESGSFRETFELPAGLEDGNHRVVAILTPPDEPESVADYEFAVERRKISELEAAPLGTPVAASSPAAGSAAGAYPAYDLASAAPQILANQTELFALLALLGTSGSMAAMALSGGGSAGGANTSTRERRSKKRSAGKVSGAGAKVHRFDAEHQAWGDASPTWRAPGWSALDRWSLGFPHRVSRWSPMLARTLQDGTYLRAAVGTLWLALPASGLMLGIGAGVNADGSYLPPTTAWVIALVVLGVVDSFAGLTAGVAYLVTTAILGGVPTMDGAQATVGLLALWFAPAVIAACTRPLRRPPATTWEGRWDRLCDAAMAPLWGAWGAQGIAWAQSGLSGRQLPISDDALRIAVVAFVALAVRFGLETLASNLYPERLVATDCGRFEPPRRAQQLASLALKTVLFVVVGAAFFPLAWQFWASAGFFVFSAVAGFDWIKERMPNSDRVYRWMPGGLLKGILMVMIGRQFAAWLKDWQPDPTRQVLDGMLFLAMPGLALTLLALFSHRGERPGMRWWHRFVGIPLLVITIGFKVGWF